MHHDVHNVMAAATARVDDETRTMDPIEQAARATQEACGLASAGLAVPADHAVRTSVDQMHRNAETLRHALQCCAKLAARLSERSADQAGRALGIAGEEADEASHRTVRNFEAIAQSGAALTEITQRLCEDWADLARERVDRGFDRFDAFLQCRTPQDFTALQSELMRDNMETFLCYARKAGEHSARIAGQIREQAAAGGRRAA